MSEDFSQICLSCGNRIFYLLDELSDPSKSRRGSPQERMRSVVNFDCAADVHASEMLCVNIKFLRSFQNRGLPTQTFTMRRFNRTRPRTKHSDIFRRVQAGSVETHRSTNCMTSDLQSSRGNRRDEENCCRFLEAVLNVVYLWCHTLSRIVS